MIGRLRQRLAAFAGMPWLPRRTVRLRLTALYGVLFLASGAGLLVVTNVLVRSATQPKTGASFIAKSPLPGGVVSYGQSSGGSTVIAKRGPTGATQYVVVPNLTPDQLQLQSEQLRQQVVSAHNDELHQLMTYSEIAFALMAVISIVLGWIVAGRVLRPLRTLATAAQNISATNLHARLPISGPDDELKDLGTTFNQLLARLERSFESQRRFVANASHELRTPLARQRTLAQVALSDPDADADSLRAAHERVLASGAQQERLIEALLTMASGEAGIKRRELVDLSVVTEGVLLHPPDEIARLGLSVATTIMPGRLLGDPRLVERLVANLVDNAARHNVQGGTLEVSTGTRGSRAYLEIANTGPVIPAGEIERLMQPFQRMTKERTANGGGVGLGLSIAKAVAVAHGAGIDVVPRPGGGLVVRVGFPPVPTTTLTPKHGVVVRSEPK